ncbi:phosducin-like protein [Polypterus senegalus]
MTTLDDKLLGEKLQYYYSSSEDEESDKEEDAPGNKNVRNSDDLEVEYSNDGSAINTGPKGVINDWRKYKQLENEQREEQRNEMERLIKKLSMSCRSHLDEEREKEQQKELQEKVNGKLTLHEYNMLQEEDDEDFLQQYRKQRIDDMRRQLCSKKRFEQVFELQSTQDFLDTVDKEEKNTLVIIHIYEDGIPACEAMAGCMICLATEYPLIKFCKVKSAVIGTSSRFTENALPALLVYKSGDLIGNFVRITDQLGEDFFAVDLEAFLQEYGLLPDKDAILPSSIRNSSVACVAHSDDDSDLEID